MNVDSAEITAISLFSGAAGLDLGAEYGGFITRSVVYVEREAYACEVLASRMDKGDLAPAPLWTDVSTFDGRPFRGLVDCVLGGFPCQDISVAGKRAGIEGERSGLWKQFRRIIEEVQPRLVIVENVARLVKAGLEVVLGDLAALGFDAEWGTLRASDVGATHSRDRLFLLAYNNNNRLEGVGGSGVLDGERASLGDDSDGQGGSAVANARRLGEHGLQPISERGSVSEVLASGEGDEAVADSSSSRREGHRRADGVRAEKSWTDGYWPPPPDAVEWREVVNERPDLEPAIRRVADGLAYRLDRLRLTGNGVVPAQAAETLRQLDYRRRNN